MLNWALKHWYYWLSVVNTIAHHALPSSSNRAERCAQGHKHTTIQGHSNIAMS